MIIGQLIALRSSLPRSPKENGRMNERGIDMAVLETALCQTHRNNISRYERLLKTYLTEIERNFVELRLSEEHAALRLLDQAPRYEVIVS
jgi:hypothetical protein